MPPCPATAAGRAVRVVASPTSVVVEVAVVLLVLGIATARIAVACHACEEVDRSRSRGGGVVVLVDCVATAGVAVASHARIASHLAYRITAAWVRIAGHTRVSGDRDWDGDVSVSMSLSISISMSMRVVVRLVDGVAAAAVAVAGHARIPTIRLIDGVAAARVGVAGLAGRHGAGDWWFCRGSGCVERGCRVEQLHRTW